MLTRETVKVVKGGITERFEGVTRCHGVLSDAIRGWNGLALLAEFFKLRLS